MRPPPTYAEKAREKLANDPRYMNRPEWMHRLGVLCHLKYLQGRRAHGKDAV